MVRIAAVVGAASKAYLTTPLSSPLEGDFRFVGDRFTTAHCGLLMRTSSIPILRRL